MQAHERGGAKTFVTCPNAESKRIVGFYTRAPALGQNSHQLVAHDRRKPSELIFATFPAGRLGIHLPPLANSGLTRMQWATACSSLMVCLACSQ
jgi:hypothetical protein